MRKTKEILRLHHEARRSGREIARTLGVSPATVQECLRRARIAGVDWTAARDLNDTALEGRLYPPPAAPTLDDRPLPDFAELHTQLKRKGVTLALLWEEYKALTPEGLQYSQFCERYRRYSARVDLVMRQPHRAGEKLFVDYAGPTVPVVDRSTGEIRAHPTYQEFAKHYGVAIIPARARKPRDKAKAENGVLLVERWILARLRHHAFFRLGDLNTEIDTLLLALNRRPFRKLPGSRCTLFEQLDRPAMKPLPVQPYVFAEWRQARVHIDYHVEVDRHYYSVPYALVSHVVDARVTAHTVELLYRGQRVASHLRSHLKGRHTTDPAHMPKAHQHYAAWTPRRLIDWAEKSGAATAKLIEVILTTRAHPQQGFRSCLGIMRLGKHYGVARLEAACRRALVLGAHRYKSVESILKRGLDREPLPATASSTPAIPHDNVRGAGYYH